MPVQPISKSHQGSLSLAGLETSIRYQEVPCKAVTAIKAVGGSTISVHDARTRVDPNSLVLKADPNDNATAEGAELKFRGKAMIAGVETKIAAFRKGTAAASGGAGAATPAPTQTPAQAPPAPATAPTPAPVEDTGTGPEGNPNLNSDGTPKTPAPKPPEGEG